MPRLDRGLWVIPAALFISFRIFFLGTGLYHDDWPLLDQSLRGGSYWGAVKVFSESGILNRPAQTFLYPLFYSIAWPNPWLGQLLLFAFELLEGVLLYKLLARLLRNADLALLAATLAVLMPNRAVMHYWVSNAFQPLAHVAVLASMLAHLRWMESRKPAWLAASLLSYLFSLCCYESTAFLPLLLAGPLWLDRRRAGAPALAALKQSLAPLWPYALPFLALFIWQRWAMPYFFPHAGVKPLQLSLLHMLKAYARGLECVANRILHGCARALPHAWEGFSPALKLAWAAAAAALYTALRKPLKSPTDLEATRALFAAGGACFLAAYAPFALSGTYTPQFFGIMSRVNGAGAWAAGMLWAAGLAALHGRKALWRGRLKGSWLASGLLALIACAFTWTNWQFAKEWAISWSLQRDILAKVAPRAAKLPQGATVLLAAPNYYGQAVVFDAMWDFQYALRLAAGRPDLAGNVNSPRLRFEAKRVAEWIGGQPLKEYSYDKLYMYDYRHDDLLRVAAPPS